MSTMNKQLLQDLLQNIEARKQTEQRLKATVRSLPWQACVYTYEHCTRLRRIDAYAF